MGAKLGKGCDISHLSNFPAPEHCPSPGTSVSKLCFAAAAGDVHDIRKLLEGGARADAVDYDQRTALHVAAADGRLQAAGLLLEAGAQVNALDRWGHTPLDEARMAGAVDLQIALRAVGGVSGGEIASSADNGSSESASTPRFCVGGMPMSRQASAELSSTPRFVVGSMPVSGQASLEAAATMCCAAAAGALEVCQDLDAAGVDVNAEDYDGRTALHVASAHGHIDVVRWLILVRSDVGREDAFGLTPLSEAVRRGHGDLAQVLMDAGAELSERKDGRPFAAVDQEAAAPFPDATDAWTIPASEVRFGAEMSNTLKSVIYHATWRGTKVVAKTVLSAKTSAELARGHEALSPKGAAKRVAELQEAEAELLHEIRLLATMRHPDLVMFLGACVDLAPPFFITEFMEGGDLERYYAAQHRKLGYPYRPAGVMLMQWASAVARALSFLHGRGRPVIHRDLKPMNLLLTGNLELKVSDFGISKLLAPCAPGSVQQPGQAQAWMSGGVGSWRYMAPEVVRYEQYTDRVDIYSFALILWFMCTGRQPFVAEFGTDAELVLKEYLKGHEPRPSATAMRCPAAFRELAQECWHAVPGRRPSAHECTKCLAELCAGRDGTWRAWTLSGFTTLVRPKK